MLDDEDANNLVATGALFEALVRAEVEVRSEGYEKGEATNELEVRFPFLKSAYRVTVERVKEDGDEH